MVLRLYEAVGDRGRAIVKTKVHIKSADAANILEDKFKSSPRGESSSGTLRALEILTLVLVLE